MWTFSCIMLPLNDLHLACVAAPFPSVAFTLHHISLLFLYIIKKLMAVCSQLPALSCFLSGHFQSVIPSHLLSAHFGPAPMKTWISQASQTHIPHVNPTLYFLFLLFFSAWPHHLTPSTQTRLERTECPLGLLCVVPLHIQTLFPNSYLIFDKQ